MAGAPPRTVTGLDRSQARTAEGRATLAGEALSPGDFIDHFRIKRRVGAGGMGVVYVARDTRLGRTVALKLLHPERLGASGVKRLIAEARVTASFSHPNIVVVHELGEYRDSPYLALEYLEGESLAERLAKGALSTDEALRIGRSIADALAHAHSRGILHRDLKPGNVMLPQDGRTRVVDFGLAADAGDTESLGIAGTPGYMAPEQIAGRALTAKADIFGFGVLMLEVLNGRRPEISTGENAERPTVERADIPANIRKIMELCVHVDPEVRPSAEDLARVLARDDSPGIQIGPEESPFLGLRAFDESHADLFFGREEEIDAVVEELRAEAQIAIVGASGVGKSSFVAAGVIPRLRARGGWTILSFRPGADPFGALARALAPASQPDLAARLMDAPALAGVFLEELSAKHQTKTLLFVDQLEELFTHGASAETRERFLRVLFDSAGDPSEPARVMFTLRDDFLGRVPQLRRLRVLRSLRPDQLRRTIVEPARRAGFSFDDPSVPDAMLAEIASEPSGLPLLQFACGSLWDRRDRERRRLLRSAYTEVGGVAGALATHADQVLDALTPDQVQLAQSILLRLVSPEGTRLALSAERVLESFPAEASSVLARLTEARLLTARRSRHDASTIYELAHESLIARWRQLADWVENSRAQSRFVRELNEAAHLWDRRGRRVEETWNDDELRDARRRLAEYAPPLAELAEQFLRQGERRARQRKRRRAVTLGGMIVALATGTVLATAVALEFRRRERAAVEASESLRLAAKNVGRFILRLEPFDWDPAKLEAVPADAGELPALNVELRFLAKRRSAFDPNLPVLERFTEVRRSLEGGRLMIEVEARGSTVAVVRVHGRGRPGERCEPSVLRVDEFPGYPQRRVPPEQIALPVPTCRATFSGMVEVPAGPFHFRGPGRPPSGYKEAIDPLEEINLPAYFVDRTEVSNAAFSVLTQLSALTSISTPFYPNKGFLENAARPEYPVTAIDALTAEAFCRYFGKRLPTSAEWEKAARGGLTLDRQGVQPNPNPVRLYPWGTTRLRGYGNFRGLDDGYDAAAPVDSFPQGASPHGALNMIGNVEEWTATPARSVPNGSLRVSRGGHWDDVDGPLSHLNTVVEVDRNLRHFDYAIGVRCVADVVAEEAP